MNAPHLPPPPRNSFRRCVLSLAAGVVVSWLVVMLLALALYAVLEAVKR